MKLIMGMDPKLFLLDMMMPKLKHLFSLFSLISFDRSPSLKPSEDFCSFHYITTSDLDLQKMPIPGPSGAKHFSSNTAAAAAKPKVSPWNMNGKMPPVPKPGTAKYADVQTENRWGMTGWMLLTRLPRPAADAVKPKESRCFMILLPVSLRNTCLVIILNSAISPM